MKIVHLCLGDRFADNYNYQVNSLIKYQKKIGYDIEVIASCEGFDREGHMVHNLPARKYVGECGILITRIPYKRDDKFYYRFRKFRGLKTELEKAKPDILFMHNIQFADVPVVVRFLKENPQVIAYADNHADFSNSAKKLAFNEHYSQSDMETLCADDSSIFEKDIWSTSSQSRFS